MNNNDKYKASLDNIKTPENLKQKTLEKMLNQDKNNNNNNNNKFYKNKFLLSVAAMLVVCFGIAEFNLTHNNYSDDNYTSPESSPNQVSAVDKNAPLKFKNIKELKSILEEVNNEKNIYSMDSLTTDSVMQDSTLKSESITSSSTLASEETSNDYSKTNTQEENVDEADISKTDGSFIYTLNETYLNIINVKDLSIVSSIRFEYDEDNNFTPFEFYLCDNNLVILGNYNEKNSNVDIQSNDSDFFEDRAYFYSDITSFTKAIVYNIDDKSNPYITRETSVEGSYKTSRMINNKLFLITRKNINYYDSINDYDLLPKYKENNITNSIPVTDILHFKDFGIGSYSYGYTLIGTFDITNKEEIKIESFFGSIDTIYMSEKNLYLTATSYKENSSLSTDIIKFNIEEDSVKYQCSTTILGSLNNQFSLDEYNNYLRVATTVEIFSNKDVTDTNSLYILDENLNQTGKLTDFGLDELIKSVRFIQNKAYIVTFKQIDPLFIIDLSDPTNPKIEGELKIPGFSTYLHPYDENHIIGIGYNTKTNKNGGIQTTTVKISMFDISNIKDPKELFNNSVAFNEYDEHSNTDIMYNYKSLLFSNTKNIIGFPVTYYSYSNNNTINKSGYAIFKINMKENKFEFYDKLLTNDNYYINSSNKRILFIDNYLYETSKDTINKYDIDSLELTNSIKIPYAIRDDYVIYENVLY